MKADARGQIVIQVCMVHHVQTPQRGDRMKHDVLKVDDEVEEDDGKNDDGPVREVMGIEPVAEKWQAFGWHTATVDGHDFEALLDALDEAEEIKGKPSIVIAKTVKGKGVSIFQDKVEYHGVAPTDDELEEALKQLRT